MLANGNVNDYNIDVIDFIMFIYREILLCHYFGIGGHCFIDFADCEI